MLVLSRKLHQTIYIGDQIAVTVVGLYRDKVRLGITAPRDMEIVRNELTAPGDPRQRIELDGQPSAIS